VVFLEKNMEEIEIDLSNEILFELMLEAHKRDITLNVLINILLKEYIEKEEKKI
jgi:hypothetical protein